MPLDLTGNKLLSTSIGPNGEVIRQIATDGLVLHLDAGNKNSYIGSGTTCNDLSGFGNNGQLVNGVTYDSNNFGSFVFDGTDDYISIPNSSTVNPNTSSFSIICWVNSDPSNAGDGWDLWIGKRVNGSNGYYLGANNPLGARFMIGNDAGGRTDTGFIGYTFNTWAMFTAILNRQNNTQTIIRNNFAESSTVTPSGGNYNNSGVLSVGADIGVNQFFVNGKIGPVLIYNRALSSTEITQNYNATKGRFGL